MLIVLPVSPLSGIFFDGRLPFSLSPIPPVIRRAAGPPPSRPGCRMPGPWGGQGGNAAGEPGVPSRQGEKAAHGLSPAQSGVRLLRHHALRLRPRAVTGPAVHGLEGAHAEVIPPSRRQAFDGGPGGSGLFQRHAVRAGEAALQAVLKLVAAAFT